MSFIDYLNDLTGAHETVHGSGGKANVSSESASRGFYSSRDAKKLFTLVFDDAACSAGDFNAVLMNNDTDRDMVIRSVGVNATAAGGFKLHHVTGTAAGGQIATTPTNFNLGSPNAIVTASTVADSDASPITGITSTNVLDFAGVVAGGHEELRTDDTLRVHKDQGIAIEFDFGANATHVFGVIYFYFEKTRTAGIG